MSTSADTNKTQSTGSAATKNSSALPKVIALLVIVMLIGGGLVFWKLKFGHHGSFDRITKAEMEALIKDANPMVLKRMSEDPSMKEKQLEGIKELFSIASAGEKEFGSDLVYRRAMEFMESFTIARSYDQELHKDSGPMPAFGFITQDQIKAYWGEGQAEGAAISSRVKNLREESFKQLMDTQIELSKKSNPEGKAIEPSEEDIQKLREEFAKIKIYEEEANAKIKEDPAKWADFSARVSIQVKLQKANFMARLFQEKLGEKAKVSDAEIDKYVAEHPELSNDGEKKAKGEETLKRLSAGEDFATLAKELSEDPGSKDKGGLYEGQVQGGGFDPVFEGAALALEPGTYTTQLVKTQFGYHIIKLEKKGETKDANGEVKVQYDVRHILFSTMVKDPENPMGRDMPLKDFVKAKLQDDKEKAILEEVKAANPVVIEDFEIPAISDEQIQEAIRQQQQQQGPHGGIGAGGGPPTAGPEPKGKVEPKKEKGSSKKK